MTTAAEAGSAIVDVSALTRDKDVLFVLPGGTDYHHQALGIPFRTAAVVEAGATDNPETVDRFDVLVLDGATLPRIWGSGLLQTLRQGIRLLVLLPTDLPHICRDQTAWLDGLSWHGFGLLGNRLFAVLSVMAGPRPSDVPQLTRSLLTLTNTAFHLGVASQRTKCADAAEDAGRMYSMISEQVADRRDSELALLQHLESLLNQLSGERNRHRGVRLLHTVLNRHKTGRVLLRPLRPLRPLLVRLRTIKRSRAARKRLTSSRPSRK